MGGGSPGGQPIGRARGVDYVTKILREEWMAGVRMVVLNKTAVGGERGRSTWGLEVAASLLADYGWSSGTWRNRVNQLRKWMTFCDEKRRYAILATEVNVLSYVGYLASEGRVGALSIPQYLTTVNPYHKDAGWPAPAKTALIARLVTAYERKRGMEGV